LGTSKDLKERYLDPVPLSSKEQWKPVPGFPRYVISQYGRVKDEQRGVIVKSHPVSRKGHVILRCKAGKPHSRSVPHLMQAVWSGGIKG